MPMVSIITAVYNAEDVILDTYRSLCEQTFQGWEWLVTDDCSSDKSYSILQDVASADARVSVQRNTVNSGAAVSRNASLKRASGEFIAFMDADDLWMPDKLERQIQFMGADVDFSFTSYELIDAVGNPLGQEVDRGRGKSFDYFQLLKKQVTLGCSTVMLRRSAFSEIEMPLLRTGQDYATWLSILKQGKKAYLLDEVLTQYRILPNSISRNKFRKALRQWQIYREVEGLPLMTSAICFSFYGWRAVFRK